MSKVLGIRIGICAKLSEYPNLRKGDREGYVLIGLIHRGRTHPQDERVSFRLDGLKRRMGLGQESSQGKRLTEMFQVLEMHEEFILVKAGNMARLQENAAQV